MPSPHLRRCFSAVIVLMVAGFVARPVAASEPRWSDLAATIFTHIALDAELPNSAFPQAFAQDGDGYLWIGTENGLARWDGYRFRVYKPDPDDAESLPDGTIDSLHADAAGRLWVGMDSGGVARYDRDHDRFIRITGSGGSGAVSSIDDDGRGGVLAGTSRGVDEIDAGGALRARIGRLSEAPGAGPDRNVHAVLRDRSGVLWVGTTRGLVRRGPGSNRFRRVAFAAANSARLDVRRLLEDAAGRLWIGTQNAGPFVLDARSGIARPLTDPQSPAALHSVSITAIVEPRRGEVWLGTGDAGIMAVDVAGGRIRHIGHDPNRPTSLPADTVLAMLRDRSGLVWVATTRGISHCDGRGNGIITIFGPSDRRGGLSGDNVHAVLPLPDGRVWVGLGRNGADRLDPHGRTGRHVRLEDVGGAAGAGGVRALATTPAGDLLLGTFNGVYRTGRNTRDAFARHVGPRAQATIAVRAMHFVGATLWYSEMESGFGRLAADGRAVTILRPGTGVPLIEDRVNAIEAGPGSTLWLGTQNGLLRFDPQRTAIVERIGARASDPASLSAGLVTTVLSDRAGRLWIGTQGGGIDIVTGRDGAGRPIIRRLGIAAGLPNDSVDTLVEDRAGTIWASTDAGIAAIDPATFAVRAYGRADGLGVTGYWVNAGAAGRNGEVYFGGLGGLTVVAPELLAPWSFDPPIVATEIRIAGKPVPAGSLDAATGETSLTIAPDGNSVSVEFAALDFSGPERNRYSYQLEGFDPHPTVVDAAHRFAAYTNLPPGAYALRVRATNRTGVWSRKPLTIGLRVMPAWYQTPAFRFALALAALASILALMRARTTYLRRRQLELEREVAARTAELHATQAQLEQIAYFDTLTALPNRRMFADHFGRLAGAPDSGDVAFALVLVDLDGFKTINDTLGHDAGDAVLVEAARRLRAAVRSSDIVARLGGDEFALLLCGEPGVDDVESVCRRIVASFEPPVSLPQAAIAAKASLGVAVYPTDGRTQETVYKSADLALYDAKRSGRNTWRWYRAELRAGVPHVQLPVP